MTPRGIRDCWVEEELDGSLTWKGYVPSSLAQAEYLGRDYGRLNNPANPRLCAATLRGRPEWLPCEDEQEDMRPHVGRGSQKSSCLWTPYDDDDNDDGNDEKYSHRGRHRSRRGHGGQHHRRNEDVLERRSKSRGGIRCSGCLECNPPDGHAGSGTANIVNREPAEDPATDPAKDPVEDPAEDPDWWMKLDIENATEEQLLAGLEAFDKWLEGQTE